MATNLTLTRSAVLVALGVLAGAAFAGDAKTGTGDASSAAGATTSAETKKAEAMRGVSGGASIQQRFGGSSGLAIRGGTGSTAGSGGATGAVMGNRALDGPPRRNYRDDRANDHSRKWGDHPGKGYAKGHARRAH